MLSPVTFLKYYLNLWFYFGIFESFAFNWYILNHWHTKNLLLTLICRIEQKHFFFELVKSIKYLASRVTVGLSNPCIGPSQRIKMSFFYYRHRLINYCQHQK